MLGRSSLKIGSARGVRRALGRDQTLPADGGTPR
jgi:hypothetical protein